MQSYKPFLFILTKEKMFFFNTNKKRSFSAAHLAGSVFQNMVHSFLSPSLGI